MTLASLRQQVSFLPQEAVLFRASAAQNIGYSWPGATRAEIPGSASHDQFLARNGLYARLSQIQFPGSGAADPATAMYSHD